MAKKTHKINVIEEAEDAASLPDKVSAGAGAPASVGNGMRGEPIEDESESPIPKSSCALWSIFLLLIIIFLAIVGSLYYLKTKKFSLNRPVSDIVTNPIETNVAPGDEASIKITEADLQSGINTDDANFPLKKTSVKINPDKIILSGKTSNSFFSVSVDVSLVPKVDSGKVGFDITEIKSAGIAAPKSVSDLVNKNLGQYLDGLSSSLGNVEVSKIELNSGYMTVTGRQK